MINISLHIRKLPSATVGEGGGYSEVKYSNCQDLPKLQLGGILKSNTQSAKICLNFNLGGGILKSNTQSAKIYLNFNFRRGGGGTLEPNSRTGVFWRIWTKIYCLRSTVQKPACASQIVSHILRMWRLMSSLLHWKAVSELSPRLICIDVR